MNDQLDTKDVALIDLLDRLLTKGIFLSGDIIISVANVDLLYVGLRAIVASAETLNLTHVLKERVQ